MITKKQLELMERDSKQNDEYSFMAWGSKETIQKLIKEVKRLNKLVDSQKRGKAK